MVARGAGDVGCAHCTVLGAVEACQVCTRLVCKACAADCTTCPEPIGREVRLGLTARLRDVDPDGRIGLVSRFAGAYRLFDLRRMRWVKAELPSPRNTGFIERVSATGDLYEPVFVSSAGNVQDQYARMRRRSLRGGEATQIECPAPHRHATLSATGHYTYVSQTELAVIVRPDGVATVYHPLKREVIQGLSYDARTGIMATVTWCRIAFHRVVDDKLVLQGAVSIAGNASWVHFEPPWLAACVETTIYVWRVDENFTVRRATYKHTVTRENTLAAFSSDRKYLAFSDGRRVVVHDLERDVIVEQLGHTDDVCLVRFARGDHMLVTADEDNRVIVRPRAPYGYVRDTIEIDVPDDEVDLAF